MPYAEHHRKEKERERARKRKVEKSIYMKNYYRGRNIYTKKDISNWNKKENNPNWQGGKTTLTNIIRTSKEQQQWRSDILVRDNWTCQTCGLRGCALNVHHIDELPNIIKNNNIEDWQEAKMCKELWNKDNGVTLCLKCHKLAHREMRVI